MPPQTVRLLEENTKMFLVSLSLQYILVKDQGEGTKNV